MRARLNIRKALLSAVYTEDGVVNASRLESWKLCSGAQLKVVQTNILGVPVESAFSAKIQRRLASSVPPRPVVDITFEDAHAFLSRICLRGQEAFEVLKCGDASHTLVRQLMLELRCKTD